MSVSTSVVLDVAGVERGRRTPHCRTLVLKVASRCNLNCTYCYVYNLGDTTYLAQPKVMSAEVVDALLRRVRSHGLRHGLERFTFIFHGGEPLLAGQTFYRRFVAAAHDILEPEISPMFTLQTNGTLLTDDWCDLFGALNIHIGISLDGPPEVNDARRVDHAGRGSYARVKRGLDVALASPALTTKPGLLTVIDVRSDPLALYRHFRTLGVRMVDFLLPEATYDRPPPGSSLELLSTPYADWLIAIFDEWFSEPRAPFVIRMFDQIIGLILGDSGGLDTMGQYANEVLVIETDGGVEAIGSLKVCGHGFTKAGASVLRDDLDDALATDLARLYHDSGQTLSSTCLACPIQGVCGGGYLPHRYRAANGFDNPSVYCRDLMKLITHIQNAVLDALEPQARAALALTRLTFDDVASLVADLTARAVAEPLLTRFGADFASRQEALARSSVQGT